MTSELVEWVDAQIATSGLDDEVGLVVLAAMEGESELDAYLGGATSPRRLRAVGEKGRVVRGTFLTSIEVEGFRGIGAPVVVNFPPRPGLTIVAGRNGSGKSSIAEALEIALTGDTYRWRRKSGVAWSERWRNLHHPHSRIGVAVLEEETGPVSITTSWVDGQESLLTRTTTTQRTLGGKAQPQKAGLEDLGWSGPLEQFRPMLSYDELGGLLEQEPSKLHDALASILGVEQLADALNRLQVRLKERKDPRTAAATRRKALQATAAQMEDQRAVEATALLKKASPDTAALRRLVTGSRESPAEPIGALKALTSITFSMDADKVSSVATRVRAAIGAVADCAAGMSRRALARLELLEAALGVHAEHGDMTCPVCREGTLDAPWAETSRALVAGSREQFADYESAKQTLDIALGDLRKVLIPRPAALRGSPIPEIEGAVAAARIAWDELLALPEGDENVTHIAKADHVETKIEPLLDALQELRATAAEELERLNDVWQPLATRIAAWCDEWDAAVANAPIIDRLTKAEKWLKDNELKLKNERLKPITDGARHAWSKLRQESNVEIGHLALEGSKTRRRVQIAATIDGTDAGSIAVLSQGELHALALALFIPRAMMADSPFRFLILDDPVQAMDPAKVDGLVDLLGDLAKDRQVIVLSHDDRLPAAVRRSNIDARVLEVNRAKDSQVSIATLTDPATRYLNDAFGLIKEWEDGRLEEFAVRRTLPGLLRFAVEAAAKDRYFIRAVQAGTGLVEVEQQWHKAVSTRAKVILAVFGEPMNNSERDCCKNGCHGLVVITPQGRRSGR